jgi:hypothetical protein
MNYLKKAGILIYGTGFSYTFLDSFVEFTEKEIINNKYKKKFDAFDYTMYSFMNVFLSTYNGLAFPFSLPTKLIVKYKKESKETNASIQNVSSSSIC